MALKALNRIQKELAGKLSVLCPKWTELHGDF